MMGRLLSSLGNDDPVLPPRESIASPSEPHMGHRGLCAGPYEPHKGFREFSTVACESHITHRRVSAGLCEVHTPPCTNFPDQCEAHIGSGSVASARCDVHIGSGSVASAQCDVHISSGSVASARCDAHISTSSVASAQRDAHISTSSVASAQCDAHISTSSVASAQCDVHIGTKSWTRSLRDLPASPSSEGSATAVACSTEGTPLVINNKSSQKKGFQLFEEGYLHHIVCILITAFRSLFTRPLQWRSPQKGIGYATASSLRGPALKRQLWFSSMVKRPKPSGLVPRRAGYILLSLGSCLLAHETHPLGNGDFHTRLAQAHSLPADLPAERIATLCAWLAEPTAESGEAVLKNDVLNRLRAQDTQPAILPNLLADIANNPEMSLVMRDYAIQHLGTLPQSRIADSHVSKTLWQATQHTEDSRAGTALLALARRQPRNPQLASTALRLAAESSAATQTRIPALLVCGQLRLEEAASIARSLSQHSDVSLQMAALATLGQVGTHQDLELLDEARYTPSPRIIRAAETAFESLKARLEGRMSL